MFLLTVFIGSFNSTAMEPSNKKEIVDNKLENNINSSKNENKSSNINKDLNVLDSDINKFKKYLIDKLGYQLMRNIERFNRAFFVAQIGDLEINWQNNWSFCNKKPNEEEKKKEDQEKLLIIFKNNLNFWFDNIIISCLFLSSSHFKSHILGFLNRYKSIKEKIEKNDEKLNAILEKIITNIKEIINIDKVLICYINSCLCNIKSKVIEYDCRRSAGMEEEGYYYKYLSYLKELLNKYKSMFENNNLDFFKNHLISKYIQKEDEYLFNYFNEYLKTFPISSDIDCKDFSELISKIFNCILGKNNEFKKFEILFNLN